MQRPKQAAAFAALHAAPDGFVMPNAWDAGSAILMAEAGFKAIATTSAGIAFSLGKPDYGVADPRLAVSREQMFERMREIVEAVSVPVNGDLEAGYGKTPEDAAHTIRLAIDAGLAGGNIEDRDPGSATLIDEARAIARIEAAAQTIAASGVPFVLTARTDPFLANTPDALATAIRRGNLYLKAGATCIYAPGPTDRETVATLAREIDGPINVVIGLGNSDATTHGTLAAGAKRISLGGSIARSALGFVRNWMSELQTKGTMTFAAHQMLHAELNALFSRPRGS